MGGRLLHLRPVGQMSPDGIVSSFRIILVVAALAHFGVYREWPALVYAAMLLGANLLGLVPTGRRQMVRAMQVLLDLALTVWVIGWGAPAVGVETTLWALLLLPATEAAVYWQLRGALGVCLAGMAAVHAVVAPPGGTLADQLAVLSVTLAVGLLSEVTEYRLRALARARRETAHRAALMSAVATAARAVTVLEPGEVLQAVTAAALELGFDMTEICLLSEDGALLIPVAQRGWPAHHPPASQPAGSGVAGQAVAQGRTVVVDDYQTWEHALPIHRRTGIARSAAACPITIGDELTAVLTVANSEPRELTDYERECLELLATQAGIALHHAEAFAEGRRQRAELARLATRDPLTGLSNRTHLLEQLEERFDGSATGEGRTTVLFVDLDRFKDVNDTYGHQTGDQVLAVVADRLRAAVRPEDVVARWGGDEFIVLVDRAPREADLIARRILRSVSRPVGVEGATVTPALSVGVAVQRPDDSPESLLHRADERMYRAKDAGGATYVRDGAATANDR